jgi:hypothetical protein
MIDPNGKASQGQTMKAPRFTIRFLMIVVAVSGAAVWGFTLWRRSTAFAASAAVHQSRLSFARRNLLDEHTENRWELSHDPYLPRRFKTTFTSDDMSGIAHYERVVAYEERMYRKYVRAARLPWLPVEADPPSPWWNAVARDRSAPRDTNEFDTAPPKLPRISAVLGETSE